MIKHPSCDDRSSNNIKSPERAAEQPKARASRTGTSFRSSSTTLCSVRSLKRRRRQEPPLRAGAL